MMNNFWKNMLRKIFRSSLNILFSNNPDKLAQIALPNRYQLIWISEYVGRKIALRSWEITESNFFQNYLKEGDICLDIGANIGYYTHLFASKVGSNGAVISIEPLKRNACLIELNSVINNTNHFVKVVPTAVSDLEDSELEFSQTADSAFSFVVSDSSKSRLGSDHIKPGSEKSKMPTTTIDLIVKTLSLKKVDIVKMDVEGFEYRVLNGMSNLLANSSMRPRLMMIELLSAHLDYYHSSIDEVCNFLEAYGYASKIINKKGVFSPYEPHHHDKIHNVFFVSD
ncbi:MAG: FkbM family methyltransferase [Coleofasciculus chthonoplastes F3-SA18-01]|uniref:FkbM family methyltransferase n=1 Tax=Coleofasciculus chthonoplastes TaxID=64178 RepID=UPI0032F7C0E9